MLAVLLCQELVNLYTSYRTFDIQCISKWGAVDYGGCDYGECDYGGFYGECDYGGCVSVGVWPMG